MLSAVLRRPWRRSSRGNPLARQESHRRTAVACVFLIYALALAEGALRKWVVPGFAMPLYFLRDPVVIGLYAYVLQFRLFRLDGWARTWFVFATTISLVSIFPYAAQGLGLPIWGFGVRSYWLYMPLAFVIGAIFTREDVYRFIRLNLILAIPYAALVVLQVRSPVGSFVNASIAADETIALVAGGMVRPYGLFTYTGQNVIFVGSLVAMFLAYLLAHRARGRAVNLLALAALAIASAAVLTGSRSIYFVTGAIFLLVIGGSLTAPRLASSLGTMLKISLFVAAAALLFTTVYVDAYQTMQERFENAARSEGGIDNRLSYDLLSFLPALETAPLLGHGIGLGAPALSGYLNRPNLEFGESDLTRHVNELGVIGGVAMILLRLAFVSFIIMTALTAARRGELELLPLAGYVAVYLAQGQITHSTLSGFQVWCLTGLVLSLARSNAPQIQTKVRRCSGPNLRPGIRLRPMRHELAKLR